MAKTETWQVSDDAAVLYEEKFVPALFGAWAPMVADIAGIRAGQFVLDVACGTGVLAREAVRLVGLGGSVTGLDLNEGMLAVARRIQPEVDWRQGNAESLPFDDGSFDVVVSQFALMYFQDRAKALGEMWRVLKSGGRLAVASWATLEQAPGYDALARIASQRTNAEAAAVLRAPFVLGDSGSLIAIYGDAGIPNPRLITRNSKVRFPSIREFVEAEVKGSPVDELLSEAEFSALLSDAERELESFCTEDGLVELPIAAHVVFAQKP